MHSDLLEPRRHLSGDPVQLHDGVLTIVGRDRADDVLACESLSFKRTADRIVRNDFVVTLNGQSFTFPVADVHRVVARLGKGDDHCRFGLLEHAFHKLVRRDGAIRSVPTNIGVTVYGQGGNDWLEGLDGPQLLDGGLGNDYLDGAFGNDTLFGGEGNDYLIDMPGSDVLLGGYGDDYIGQWYDPARFPSGPDHIDGGPGTDTIDLRDRAADPLISIERHSDAYERQGMQIDLTRGFVP